MSMGTAARLGAEGKLDRSAAEASTSRVADGASRVAAMPGVAKAFGGRLVSRARARAAELVTAAASRSPFAVSRFQRSFKMAMDRGPGFDRRLLSRRSPQDGGHEAGRPRVRRRRLRRRLGRGRRCARRPGHRPGQRVPSREAGRCSGAGDRCRARHRLPDSAETLTPVIPRTSFPATRSTSTPGTALPPVRSASLRARRASSTSSAPGTTAQTSTSSGVRLPAAPVRVPISPSAIANSRAASASSAATAPPSGLSAAERTWWRQDESAPSLSADRTSRRAGDAAR